MQGETVDSILMHYDSVPQQYPCKPCSSSSLKCYTITKKSRRKDQKHDAYGDAHSYADELLLRGERAIKSEFFSPIRHIAHSRVSKEAKQTVYQQKNHLFKEIFLHAKNNSGN